MYTIKGLIVKYNYKHVYVYGFYRISVGLLRFVIVNLYYVPTHF